MGEEDERVNESAGIVGIRDRLPLSPPHPSMGPSETPRRMEQTGVRMC